jgi:hypothetical protein
MREMNSIAIILIEIYARFSISSEERRVAQFGAQGRSLGECDIEI